MAGILTEKLDRLLNLMNVSIRTAVILARIQMEQEVVLPVLISYTGLTSTRLYFMLSLLAVTGNWKSQASRPTIPLTPTLTYCCTKCLPDNNHSQNSPLKAGLVRSGTGHSTQQCPIPVTHHMHKGTSVFCLCLRRLQEWPTYTDIWSTALFSNIFSYCCSQQTRACHTPGSALTGIWDVLSWVPGPAEGAQARSWCLHLELQQLTPCFS